MTTAPWDDASLMVLHGLYFDLRIRSEFTRRHLFYCLLDRHLHAQTRFFAAAAWTNRIFALLFESGPSWVSVATRDFLDQLGVQLEAANRRFAMAISLSATACADLDTRLVAQEQCTAQVHLEAARAELAAWPQISEHERPDQVKMLFHRQRPEVADISTLQRKIVRQEKKALGDIGPGSEKAGKGQVNDRRREDAENAANVETA